MSSFTKPLKVEYLLRGDKPFYKLLKTFEYYTELPKGEKRYLVVVPVGFVTNFASIPKLFHSILTPAGRHGKSTIIHDFFYFTIKKQLEEDLLLAENWVDVMIAKARADDCRKLADQVFKEAMDVLEVTPWKRDVMYTMVRLFGFTSIHLQENNNE